MQSVLARHDELLRDTVAAHAGHVVKTTGDGIHAVFATAHDALDAAVAMQLGLGEDSFGDPVPVRVRIGVHTCEAQYRDGDYYGSEVNRAARLMSIAHGGQVVVSASTRSLVRDGPVELVDLGEHRLRDLTMAERVFEVRAPGLSAGFPALRSLDAFPGNLPRQLTSFVGRHAELAGIVTALDEWRLVTVTGTGGVGKTRLAVQVAAETLPRFGDGAWWCELAVASDGETMAQVVAAELGVSQRAGMSLPASISEYLRPKELLLVLDNCEQLLGPVSEFAERILRECPEVRILATSREGLAVEGERVWPLRSLPLPDATGAEIATNDAVRLFVERVEAARASFGLDASNVDCGRGDLSSSRWDPVGDRTGGGAGGVDVADGDQRAARRAVPAPHWRTAQRGGTPPDVASHGRLVVFAARRARAGGVRPSRGVRRQLRRAARRRRSWWTTGSRPGTCSTRSRSWWRSRWSSPTRPPTARPGTRCSRRCVSTRGNASTSTATPTVGDAATESTSPAWAEEAGPALEGPDELAWRVREIAELDNLRAAVTWALDHDAPSDTELALRIVSALADDSMWQPALGVGAWAVAALPHLASATRRCGTR